MNSIAERRTHPRQVALFSAKYTIKSETFRDLISNVSAGGIYIRTWRSIPDGERIRLRFPIVAFDRRPDVMGTVVRTQEQGFAVQFDTPLEERIPKWGQARG